MKRAKAYHVRLDSYTLSTAKKLAQSNRRSVKDTACLAIDLLDLLKDQVSLGRKIVIKTPHGSVPLEHEALNVD